MLGSVYPLVTIFQLRMPGMTMFRLLLFTWRILTTQLMTLLAFPVLTSASAMEFIECKFRGRFFDPAGGNPVLYRHLWFLGHQRSTSW